MVRAKDDPHSVVPWGRPPLRDIPMPPFASREEHQAFLKHLAVHVVGSGAAPLERNDAVLLSLIEDERDALGWDGDFPRELSRASLRIAIRTFFPAPWTPRGLIEALQAVGLESRFHVSADWDKVVWDMDPMSEVRRQSDGSWRVTENHRGDVRVLAEHADDDELVMFLLETLDVHGPFPIGSCTDGVPVDDLIAAAAVGRATWQRHAELPYLRRWTQIVERVRGARAGTAQPVATEGAPSGPPSRRRRDLLIGRGMLVAVVVVVAVVGGWLAGKSRELDLGATAQITTLGGGPAADLWVDEVVEPPAGWVEEHVGVVAGDHAVQVIGYDYEITEGEVTDQLFAVGARHQWVVVLDDGVRHGPTITQGLVLDDGEACGRLGHEHCSVHVVPAGAEVARVKVTGLGTSVRRQHTTEVTWNVG